MGKPSEKFVYTRVLDSGKPHGRYRKPNPQSAAMTAFSRQEKGKSSGVIVVRRVEAGRKFHPKRYKVMRIPLDTPRVIKRKKADGTVAEYKITHTTKAKRLYDSDREPSRAGKGKKKASKKKEDAAADATADSPDEEMGGDAEEEAVAA